MNKFRKSNNSVAVFGSYKMFWFIFLAGLLAIAGSFFLQPKRPLIAEYIVAKMKQELGLNDKQVGQITPVIQGEIQQMQIIMAQARSQKAEHEAVKKQMSKLHQSTELKLAQYLTPQQLARWKSSN